MPSRTRRWASSRTGAPCDCCRGRPGSGELRLARATGSRHGAEAREGVVSPPRAFEEPTMRVPNRRAIAFPAAAMLSLAWLVIVPTASPAVAATPGSPRDSSAAGLATTAGSFLRNDTWDGGIQGWQFFAQPPSAGHGEWAPHEGLEGSGALHVSATAAGGSRQLMLWNAVMDS